MRSGRAWPCLTAIRGNCARRAPNLTAFCVFEGTGETAWGRRFVPVAARSADVHRRMILDLDVIPSPGGETAVAIACFRRVATSSRRARNRVRTTLRGARHQEIALSLARAESLVHEPRRLRGYASMVMTGLRLRVQSARRHDPSCLDHVIGGRNAVAFPRRYSSAGLPPVSDGTTRLPADRTKSSVPGTFCLKFAGSKVCPHTASAISRSSDNRNSSFRKAIACALRSTDERARATPSDRIAA